MDTPELTLDETTRELSYILEVSDADLSKELNRLHYAILEMESEKKKVIASIVKIVTVPTGWNVVSTAYSYTGSVTAKVYKSVILDQPKLEPTNLEPTKAKVNNRTPLQKLAQEGIDIKSLLNSAVLTREEKRKLLGIDELLYDKGKDNE